MPRPLTSGKQATFNHARVVYSPFGTKPGAQFVLTADPWSYLTATINQKLNEGARGSNKLRLERALYYADLAESFYAATKFSALPASGTLAYYGVLNLVKCFLSLNSVDLETQNEHHGLSLPIGTKTTVRVSKPQSGSLSIFGEFARLLGKPIAMKEDVTLEEISRHLPELHEMAFTLSHLPDNKRGFLPVDIQFLFSEDDSKIFTEVTYEKKQLTRVDTSKFMSGQRKLYFRPNTETDIEITHRSKSRKAFSWENLPRIYKNICTDYSKFDFASLLTQGGYKYYCDLRGPKWHHLSYSLLMMFYVGTAARYRPSEMNELLHSDMRPLIAEALAVIPGQMLYHLVSLCTSRNCVVPHSTIAS